MSASVSAPPETFNFARHMLDANAGRPDKTAFVDDERRLSYGELDERVRRFAAALKDAGVKREERVLLLMLDSCDWPVAFLGSILAGAVPVAVNTLLTADDYAYMLEHARAQAAIVSGAVKPALKAALTKSDHEVHKVVVSRPTQPLEFGEVEFEAFLDGHAPLARPAATHADDPAFWLYSSGSTGRPKGDRPFARQPVLDGRALRQGDPRASRGRRLLFCGEAVLRLRSRQRADLPARGRRDRAADGRAADAGRRLQALARRGRRREAHGLLRRADRLRRHARLARPAQARGGRAATRLLGGRGAAGRDRRAVQAPFRRRHRRRHRLDRDAAHLHLEPAGQGALWHDRLAGAGLRYRAARRRRRAGPGRRARRPLHPRALGGADVLGQSREDARNVPGRLDQGRRQVHPQRRRLLHLRRPHRRHAQGQRRLCQPVRGRSDPGPAPRRAGSRRHRRTRRRGSDQDQGVRRPEAGRSDVDDAELKAFVKDRLAPYKYPRAIEFVADLPKTATGKIQRFKLREMERART